MHLRLVDVVKQMDGLARSTVADWISDYHMYIPYVMDGRTKLYLPETVDVLKRIKELKEMGLYKPDILKTLANEGFTITVEDAAEEIKEQLKKEVTHDKREDLMSVFAVMGEAVKEIAASKLVIEKISELTDDHSQQLKEKDELIREQQKIINELTNRIEKIEERNKLPLIKRIFNK